ncbi:MAG: hypothetical protein AAF393_14230 [Pseudomonadota bacterium]
MPKADDRSKAGLTSTASLKDRLIRRRDNMQSVLIDQLLDPAPLALAQLADRLRQYTETYLTVLSLEARIEQQEEAIDTPGSEAGLDFAKAHAEIIERLTRLDQS